MYKRARETFASLNAANICGSGWQFGRVPGFKEISRNAVHLYSLKRLAEEQREEIEELKKKWRERKERDKKENRIRCPMYLCNQKVEDADLYDHQT